MQESIAGVFEQDQADWREISEETAEIYPDYACEVVACSEVLEPDHLLLRGGPPLHLRLQSNNQRLNIQQQLY